MEAAKIAEVAQVEETIVEPAQPTISPRQRAAIDYLEYQVNSAIEDVNRTQAKIAEEPLWAEYYLEGYVTATTLLKYLRPLSELAKGSPDTIFDKAQTLQHRLVRDVLNYRGEVSTNLIGNAVKLFKHRGRQRTIEIVEQFIQVFGE